jgi:SM-20-related protein
MSECAVVTDLAAKQSTELNVASFEDSGLFEHITNNLADKGYSIHPNALPFELSQQLAMHVQQLPETTFKRAGVGREQDHMLNDFVRTDQIVWINGDHPVQQAWLDWAQALQQNLNRTLFLGLFSFESHFAHYAAGDFYKKHQDAFQGEANRVVSLVLYLNSAWLPEEGGELVLYTGENQQQQVKVLPLLGTIAVFLSEQFPHEVLPATRDRYSIACWFRLNNANIDGIKLTP